MGCLGLVALPGPHGFRDRQIAVICGENLFALIALGRDQLGLGDGAVDAAPMKTVIGETISVVPAQLGGDKVLQARLVHDLRQVGRIAKCVRQPDSLGINAKILAVKAPPAHDLANQRLPGDDVDVGLHPHGPFDLELARLDALQQPRPKLGIILSEEIE